MRDTSADQNRLVKESADPTHPSLSLDHATATIEHSYDVVGNRTQVSEGSGRITNYAYDKLYRLESENIAGDPHGIDGTVDYAYDQVGNRLARDSSLVGVANQTHTYSDNDLLDSDTYDANGNTTVSDYVAQRSGTYAALLPTGRLKFVFFAPTAPGPKSGDSYANVGRRHQLGIGVTGGRLFGVGVRTSKKNVDQVFRIDYWDVRPGHVGVNPHYHIGSGPKQFL